MRTLIIIISIIYAFTGNAQMLDPAEDYFMSPVDKSIILSGSFAELRSTHFHAGIDIKPQAADGIDTVRAAADGYVSRIKVQTGGYGQVLYIDHPNGYTSVYAHLDEFKDTVARYIEDIQLKSKSYTLDIYPDSSKFQVRKGEAIGLMGNTGRSYAKHLHFEIRETLSEIPVNPALFNIKPQDTRPPVVLSVDLHKLTQDYHEQYSRTFYPTQLSTSEYTINGGDIKFPAYSCGISIQSYDLMNGAPNRNGVYYQHLYVDDSLHASFVMDKVSFDESRYINSHIDFKERVDNNRTMVRSYVLPGNQLGIYKEVKNDGIIKLYEKVPRKIKVVLGDIEGNESLITFSLSRDPVDVAGVNPTFNTVVKHGVVDTVSLCGARIIFGINSLDRDLYLSCNNERDEYIIGKPTVKLFQSAQISLPSTGIPDSLKKFASIFYLDDDEWINMGGKFNGESIVTYSSALGKFKIGYDTIPPAINIFPLPKWIAPGTKLKATLDDNIKTGGMASELKYNVFLDGNWIIAPYKSMTRKLSIPVPGYSSPGIHTLEITCEDHQGNKSHTSVQITIN